MYQNIEFGIPEIDLANSVTFYGRNGLKTKVDFHARKGSYGDWILTQIDAAPTFIQKAIEKYLKEMK